LAAFIIKVLSAALSLLAVFAAPLAGAGLAFGASAFAPVLKGGYALSALLVVTRQSAPTPSVTIAIRRAVSAKLGPTVELVITDTGPGIDLEMVARAFKLYAQLSNSSIRKHRGMGLGLAVVQRNAIALGATIVVNSSLMQGSVFIVTIPISETPATRPLSFRA